MSTSLPAAVLEAEKRANEIHEELLKQRQQTDAGQGDKGQQTNEDPNAGSTQSQGISGDSNTGSSGQGDQLEHRYKVLQGKYNSEVPRLAAENKDLKAELQRISHELEVLKNSKPAEPLVKPEEVEEYGPGLVDLARRIAREELAAKDAEINVLKSRIDGLTQTTVQKVETDFFTLLKSSVPDWESINADPLFLAWLDETDELTGATRQALLSQAEKARDAARVANFFNAYKRTSTSRAANASASLESQVAPNTNKAPDTPPSKKIWTRREISEFYARARRGEVTDEQVVAIEAELQKAQIEGRIR